MDVVDVFVRALEHGDRDGMRLALHPYVRWTCADGRVVAGRSNVLSMLDAGRVLGRPAALELRDDQIYRWRD
jgi:hypothetical protein